MNRVFVFLFACLLFPLSLSAQSFWLQTTGPGSGPVTAFGKGKSGVIIAASENNIYYSTNNGGQWTKSDQTFEFLTQNVISADANGKLYAVTIDALYTSDDNGKTWAQTDAVPTSFASLTAITIDKKNDIIYVGTNGGDRKGLYHSDDGGKTWTSGVAGQYPTQVGVADIFPVRGIAVSKTSSSVFICTDGGVARSDDDGVTWKIVGFGGQSIGLGTDESVGSIACTGSGKVFAIVSGAVFMSTNNGDGWSKVSGTKGLNTTAAVSIAADDNDGVILCGSDGVWMSLDGGASWKQSLVETDKDPEKAVLMTGDAAFVGTQVSAVSYSSDKGKTWYPRNRGIIESKVTAMCADNHGNVFASAVNSSVYATRDAGNSWIIKDAQGVITGKDIRALGATTDNTLFASAYGDATDPANGVYKSIDGGENWTNLASTMIGTYKSKVVTFTTPSNGYLFAGADNGNVFIAKDNGTTWLNSGKAVRDGIIGRGTVGALVYTNQNHVFAANDSGVYRLTNYETGNMNWDTLFTAPLNVLAMSVDLNASPNIIYAVTANAIYHSNDDGNTWAQSTSSITGAIGIAAAKGKAFALGTNGTFSSSDKGITFTLEPNSSELNTLKPTMLFVDKNDLLYAGTEANGVFRNTPVAGVFTPSTRAAELVSFENNYPNPFFNSTVIRYSLVKPSSVTLEVFDMNGKFVTSLVNEFQNDGDHSVTFDATAFSVPSGVYNCRLSANGESVMKAIVYLSK